MEWQHGTYSVLNFIFGRERNCDIREPFLIFPVFPLTKSMAAGWPTWPLDRERAPDYNRR